LPINDHWRNQIQSRPHLGKRLVEDQNLDAVISMPSGVFKPYAGVSTAILFFTKTNSGGTDQVWFYDMKQDGFSLDDKRTPQPDKSDLPDILKRWKNLAKEKSRARTDSSFLVPEAEIVANGSDLSLNRYNTPPPTKIRRHRRIRRAPEGRAARPPRRTGRPLRRPPAPRLLRGTLNR
jgi:type I restriction-modification system DNA methylase subunit